MNVEQTNGGITLHIHDNGKGFDPSLLREKRTFGLSGMQERVSILGGKFKIVSRALIGTDISIQLPVGFANNAG